MTRILLIRHGATDLMGRVLYGRMPDVHINSTGRTQASCLARALQHRYNIAQIVSSPLERAQETVACLQSFWNAPIELDEGFLELDYGRWMGMSFEAIRQLESWEHFNKSRSTGVPPEGESMMQVQARAWAALDRILLRWDTDEEVTVGIVSHGDVIRALLILFLGMPADHIHRFDVAPGSVSEVVFHGRFPKVVCINQNFYE